MDFTPEKPWTFFSTAARFASRPRDSFTSVSHAGAMSPPICFLIMLWLSCALGRALVGWVLGASPADLAWLNMVPLEAFWSLVMALCLHLALRIVGRAPVRPALSMRLTAYGLGPWLLTVLTPLLPTQAGEILILAVLAMILYLVFAGVRASTELSPPLSAAVLLIGLVLFMIMQVLLRQI